MLGLTVLCPFLPEPFVAMEAVSDSLSDGVRMGGVRGRNLGLLKPKGLHLLDQELEVDYGYLIPSAGEGLQLVG